MTLYLSAPQNLLYFSLLPPQVIFFHITANTPLKQPHFFQHFYLIHFTNAPKYQ